MNKKSWKAALAASILSLLGTTSVRAGLLSSEVNVGAYFAGDFTGAEISFTDDGLPHGFQPYSVDYFFVVLDDKIIMDYSSGTYPNRWSDSGVSLDRDGIFIRNGYLFSFIGAAPIISITLEELVGLEGFSSSNISFNGKEVGIDLSGIRYTPGDKIVLAVESRTVGEPAILSICLLALGGAAATSRRTRQRT